MKSWFGHFGEFAESPFTLAPGTRKPHPRLGSAVSSRARRTQYARVSNEQQAAVRMMT